MATTVISHSTEVDSWPLRTIGDEETDQDVRPGRATKLSTALSEAAVDHQDTSDSDDQGLGGEKELEVQCDTQDRPRPRPRPQPQPQLQSQSHAQRPAAAHAGADDIERLVPAGVKAAAPTKHGAGSGNTTDTHAEKQQEGASTASRTADAGSETSATDADADDKSCLPFRRNKTGPRKGGKRKEKGALGRVFEKISMGLFSKKKKEAVEENPYASPITSYQQARNDLAQSRAPGGPGGPGGLPSNPRVGSFASPAPSFSSSNAPPPYQSPASTYQSPSVASDSSRFGDEKYGNQNGYGSNRFDNGNQRRPGGYGGFDDDAGSKDLFGGASNRYVPPQQGSNGSPANGSAPFQPRPSRFDDDPSKNSLLGDAGDRYNPLPPANRQDTEADDEYGGYGAPRELTEEEQDRQEARRINEEIRATRKAGVDSINRSKAAGAQALALAASTGARLGEQGERLARTERNVDAALIMSRESENKTKELKKINDSMFSGMIGPSKKTLRKQDAATLEQYQIDKATREQTARDGYRSEQQMEQTFNELDGGKRSLGRTQRSAAEKNKFLFHESDDDMDDDAKRQAQEDEDDEDHINEGIDDLTDVARQLKGAAIGFGGQIQHQIELTDRLAGKTDAVDDRVRMNREKLSRIR